MARVFIEAGASFDAISPAELRDELDGRQRGQRDRMRGVKFRRLPPMNASVTATGTVQIGGDTPLGATVSQPQYGPSSGHMWAIRLISVNGLTAGATPDVLNLQVLGAADPDFNWWQFNGNNFAYGWGKNEFWLESGEYLSFTGSGLAAPQNTRIRVRGMIQQVPMELAAELI